MRSFFEEIVQLIETEKFNELKNVTVPEIQRFNWAQDVFEKIYVAQQPQAAALKWYDGNETLTFTYEQAIQKANQTLNFLRHHGMQTGDIALSQMGQPPFLWWSMIAIIKGGFQLIPAASILGVQDLVYRMQTTFPKLVIADAENAEKIDLAEQEMRQKVPIKIYVDGNREGWFSLQDIEAFNEQAEAAHTLANDPLFLFYTSGTTGMPKVVIHSHISYPLGHLTTASWIGLKRTDIHYNISQPGWAKFAWSSFFAPWNMGACIFANAYNGRFDAQQTLRAIETGEVTTFCAPPTVLRMLIQEDLKSYTFKLRSCVAAGEPLNPEIIAIWQKGTGIVIRDGYGQTESTCMIANLPHEPLKPGAMGKPTFLYDVVIADEHGTIMPAAEEGNICIRYNSQHPPLGIFKGYYDNKEKEAEVFKHGLYYTGDKAYADEDGYIWFIGRDDDVIKSSDYRIGPFEVESVLIEHDAVLESAVVASPHPLKGFEVKAFVVLNSTYAPSEEIALQIYAHCQSLLAPYKMPRIIEFVETLPKTISGKIRRVELRGLAAQQKAENTIIVHEYFYKRTSS